MRNSNRPFIPANDYNEINALLSFAGMNGRFDLHLITQPHSDVYCGYFRRLVFGNSLTFSHITPCFYAKPPDFPRRIGPRELATKSISAPRLHAWWRQKKHTYSVASGAWLSLHILVDQLIYPEQSVYLMTYRENRQFAMFRCSVLPTAASNVCCYCVSTYSSLQRVLLRCFYLQQPPTCVATVLSASFIPFHIMAARVEGYTIIDQIGQIKYFQNNLINIFSHLFI